MNCKHFGRCGGCTYLDIPYEEELILKRDFLRKTLPNHQGLINEVIPSPNPTGYRNKMELAFGDESKDGQLAVGMRKRRSFYEVAIPDNCVLIPNDFREIILYVLEFFRATNETFFHRKRHTGALRHLVLRRGEFTGDVLVNLSTTSGLTTPLESLVEGLKKLQLVGQLVGILHSINDGVADAVKDEDTRTLWGQNFYTETICGLKFKVSAYSFFQTNSAGAQVLYGVVNDCLQNESSKLAYDLYCGTGTITQIISDKFKKVMGIELIEDAIEAAKENAALNNINNCEFHAGDVLVALDEKRTSGEIPDIIIVDPPRDGLHPKALAKIIDISPKEIIYIACKPASLARDLAPLTEAGYFVEKISGVDMFPRTPHVEAVALMSRKK